MSSLFEPTPAPGGGASQASSGTGSGSDSSGSGGGDVDLFRGFSVIAPGRFSKVVWARRKSPWRREGHACVCAVKVIEAERHVPVHRVNNREGIYGN